MRGKRTKRWRPLAFGALAVALAFSGCGSDADDSDQVNTEPPGLLFVQPATGGTLEPAGDGYRLTLSGVDPSVTFFSDRPERIAGRLPAQAFVDIWDSEGFTDDPPNAALTIAAGHPDADVFVFELEHPRSLANGSRIVYEATPVTLVGQTAAQNRLDPVDRAPTTFGPASLLIDDVPAAGATVATAQKLTTTADSLPDPGGSPRLTSLIASLQAKSDQLAPLAGQLQQGSSAASAIPGFEQLVSAIAAQVSQITALINQLQQNAASSVDISTMFKLQLQMQLMSQYIEAVSNTLSAVHQEMITMARATKGQ